MRVVQKEKPLATFGVWEVFKDGTLKGKAKLPSGKETNIEIYPDRMIEKGLILNVVYDQLITDLGGFVRAWFFACKVLGIKQINNFQTDFE